MTSTRMSGFVLKGPENIPLNLKDRVPFTLPNTEAIFRLPESDVVGQDGDVRVAGAIEFQTQITPGLLTDVCDPNELYKPELRATHRFRCVYDPEIQRGIKDTGGGPREFLRPSEIDSMTQDIYQNTFECPQLMWNLRAGETAWVYLRDVRELRIYEGVATRPDTNHRHHAIIRMHRKYLDWIRDTGSADMGSYNPRRSYGLVIYTDPVDGEAHRFYVYNFKGWRVPTSTAHFIESKTAIPLLHSRLARALMERSVVLGANNVEILSNHLSRNSAKLVTFGTLVDALRGAFPNVTEGDYYDEVLGYLLDYLSELGHVRPNELALLSVARRQQVRDASVADQAVMWHGYIRLAARLRELKPDEWRQALSAFGREYVYAANGKKYKGDLFSRSNPLWSDKEVIAQGKTGPRVVNNRQSRQGTFEALCEVAGIPTGAPQP
ncbi:MAG: hypothetical protein HY683_03640 [Chloroflexi bacterium]|nr:hypothetical protein [Chloroflexota bacterium]